MPIIMGVRKLPLLVADAPRTPWKKSGMKMMAPNIPKPVRKVAMSDMATMRLRYISSGMMGDSARDSTNMNAAAIAQPNASGAMICGEPQAYWTPPHESASRIGVTASIMVAMPSQSSFRLWTSGVIFGKSRVMRISAGTPTGMFMKNIQFQERLSVMNPPSVGPTTDAMPNATPTKPWNLPLSSGGKRSAMETKVFAMMMPPPMPWMARKAMSWFIVWLVPARTDPARNMMMPQMKNILRP